MSKLVKPINVLNEWKRHFYSLSSQFTIYEIIDRQVVDFIYDTLVNVWGINFFVKNILEEISDNTLHFIVSLLGKVEKGSFYGLYETCLLIDHAKKNRENFYKKIDSIKFNSNALKDVLFEVYIDCIFSMNNIFYEIQPKREKQIIEGYCYINNKKILIECKKKYSVKSHELLMKQFLTGEILRIIRNANWGFECLGIIKIKNEDICKADFVEILKHFKNFLVNRVEYNFLYQSSNDKVEFIIKPFKMADHIELSNDLIDYSIYFTVQSLHKLDVEGKTEHRVLFNYSVKYAAELASKKLLYSIKKARAQHRADAALIRVFFFDNQFLNDLVSPLIRNNKYYEDEVSNYLASKKTKDIVVLIFRNYNTKVPKIDVKVICREELNDIKTKLFNMNYYLIRI